MEAGQSGEATVSQLLMQKARESDSGNSLLKIIQGKFPSINIEFELMVNKTNGWKNLSRIICMMFLMPLTNQTQKEIIQSSFNQKLALFCTLRVNPSPNLFNFVFYVRFDGVNSKH